MILFFVANDRYFCSHRLGLAIAAKKNNHQIGLVTKVSYYQSHIERQGIKVFPLQTLDRASINPLKEIKTLFALYKIYQQQKPTIVHHVALKPVIYGSFVAKVCGIHKTINALGGLGYLFTNSSFHKIRKYFMRTVVKFLLKCCHFKSTTWIVQNQDDQKILSSITQADIHSIQLIKGMGVDIYHFAPPKESKINPIVTIVFVARMLWDKGIAELIMAIKILQKENLLFRCLFFGDIDPSNPATLTSKQLIQWQEDNLITWQGHSNNIASAYQQSDIAVLPSYREGLPKVLLEAAACGLPIVTTDVPGCREVVINNHNGFLIPAKDPNALASALKKLIVHPNLREKMGHAGREFIKEHFVEQKIFASTLLLYETS